MCIGDSDTKTVCYSLYRNKTSTMVQTRICWQDEESCMDLIEFCNARQSGSCTTYGPAPSTAMPTGKRVTYPPHPSTHTNGESTATDTSTYSQDMGHPLNVAVVSGICAAAILIIIVIIILLLLRTRRRRYRNQLQISDSNKRNESARMTDGPVYDSIGPNLTRNQHNLSKGDIASSARELYTVAPRRATLLGNLQRNRSVPALVYAVNSIPMEGNDVLRTVSMADIFHGSGEPPSSSSSPLGGSPNQLDEQPTRNKVHGLSHKDDGQASTSMVPSTTGHQRKDVSRGDRRRHLTPQNGETVLTDSYDTGILPGPKSTYVGSEKESAYSKLDAVAIETAGRYASLENNPQHDKITNGTGQIPQYVELPECVDSNEYMGIPEKVLQAGGAYMDLETIKINRNNHYMGIGDGAEVSSDGVDDTEKKHIPIDVGSGAYSELNLRDNEPQSAYMGLHSAELQQVGDKNVSEASKCLEPQLTNKHGKAKIDKRKFWQSKSTFHKRREPATGVETTYEDLQTPSKTKKSLLFRRKKDEKPSQGEGVESDMCLALNLSSQSVTEENPSPQYFTLEIDEPDKKQLSNIGTSVPEYKEEVDDDLVTNAMDEPFRLRSQSQPTQQINEVYETIKADWSPINHSKRSTNDE